MELSIVVAGSVFGTFIALILRERNRMCLLKAARQICASQPIAPPRPIPPIMLIHPRIMPAIQPSWPIQIADETVSTKDLIETWRKSITGLLSLAQKNLALANQKLEAGDYKSAVDCAFTSAENASRALLHCYGEKPEQSAGQEEALKLLATRLQGRTPVNYEKAMEEITNLRGTADKCQATGGLDVSLTCTRARAEQVVASAATVVRLVSEIIGEHFAVEIPDLFERCPKCHTMDPSVMAFNETYETYTCTNCGHIWTQLRA